MEEGVLLTVFAEVMGGIKRREVALGCQPGLVNGIGPDLKHVEALSRPAGGNDRRVEVHRCAGFENESSEQNRNSREKSQWDSGRH